MSTRKEIPAPAVELHDLGSPEGDPNAPAFPVIPTDEQAAMWSEQQTQSFMRAINDIAYNKYRARQILINNKEDALYFKGRADKPMHELQPLTIRKPDSNEELLSYCAPWQRGEAVVSLRASSCYKRRNALSHYL